MSKQFRILGIIIPLGIALAVLPIKLTADDVQSGDLFLALRTFRYTFTGGVLAFFLHLWLNRKLTSVFHNRYLAGCFKIIAVALTIFLISVLLDVIVGNFVKQSPLAIAKEDGSG